MAGTSTRSALALVLLAPVCADYLAAWDGSTGDPLALARGLLWLAPLYGGPALLVRELARRRQLGWRGITLLAAAFGVVHAGLVDQALFSDAYRGLPTWDGWRQTTVVPIHGTALDLVLTFVGGAAIYGVAAPIAVIEALSAHPTEPWLGRGAFALVAILSGAAALVAGTHVLHGTPPASATEMAGAALAAGLLALAATRPTAPPAATTEPAPSPRSAFVGALAAATAVTLAADGWFSTLVGATLLGVAAWWIADAARARGWSARHAAAIGAGALASRALLAFTYVPLIGDVSPGAKLLHNLAMLGLVAALTAATLGRDPSRATRRVRLTTGAARSADPLAWHAASAPGSRPASRPRS